MKGTE
jgi:hypothetical protein